VTVRLLDSAIEMYERDPRIDEIQEDVTQKIQRRLQEDSTYYDRITVPGSIEQLIEYDVGGTKAIKLFDTDIPSYRENNYRIARDIAIVIPRFYRSFDPNELDKDGKVVHHTDIREFDPSKHKLWTLEGVKNLTPLMQEAWTRYAELIQDYKTGRLGNNS